MKESLDAKTILYFAKLNKKKILARIESDKKKKAKNDVKLYKKLTKGFVKKEHPFKPMDWGNKKRVHFNAVLATVKVGMDDVKFTESCLNKLYERNRRTQYPVIENFDNRVILGSGKLDGVINNHLLCSGTVLITNEFIEKMGKRIYVAPIIRIKKSRTENDVEIILDGTIEGISFINIASSVDDECRVTNIYSDEEVDNKLEG